ncbi:MAG TPA: 50S ribosomal protein L24 [Patescibacteria group bacterium]|nr:50S ribosomal protein L24 [Patescibacteria group bacterium]
MKFKVGDEILVTSGKDKGKRGKIERVFNSQAKVLIGGINMFKKHVKDQAGRTKTGGIIDIAKPLSVGNLAFICKKCTKPTRLGYKFINDKKVRICRKCGEEI